jgi:hypothetical protein
MTANDAGTVGAAYDMARPAHIEPTAIAVDSANALQGLAVRS